MNPKIHRFILSKVLGWKITPGEDVVPSQKKAIFLFAPHTSFWDFVVGYFYFRSLNGRLHIMIKKEAFKGPLGWLLRKLGAFPIDRSDPKTALLPLIHAMNNSESFYLCICPEGTRKPIRRWKTGYHLVAKETGADVFLAHADYRTKEVGYGQRFELGDDAREDTKRIQQKYKEMNLRGLHPKGYVTE